MLAIELVKCLLIVATIVLSVFGILGLFMQKEFDINLSNSLLILVVIALILVFHI